MESPTGPGEVTQLLLSWRQGDQEAFQQLFSLLYNELRSIARRQKGRAPMRDSLDTTGIVHEAYLKFLGQSRATATDRSHFFAIAAKVMRHILVDRARRLLAAKRKPEGGRVDLDESVVGEEARLLDLLALHQALERLEEIDPRLGHLVELRYFSGLSVEETAAALEVTDRTVRRDWRRAKAFLYSQLKGCRMMED